MTIINIDYRELSTILAALRWWQATGLNPMAYDDLIADIDDIATSSGEIKMLDAGEIDILCESINGAPIEKALSNLMRDVDLALDAYTNESGNELDDLAESIENLRGALA